MAFETGNDACLGFWALAWNGGWCQFPPGATVLEIGCAEADWQTPMLAERPDLQITGIDWRDCARPGVTIRGDVLMQEFPPASFDAIVSVSAIEHIGLGVYDGDPVHEFGDSVTMARCAQWLKPDGWLYFDVPYRPNGSYEVHGNFRAYDEAALQSRLIQPHFKVVKGMTVTTGHPDGPYAMVLAVKA